MVYDEEVEILRFHSACASAMRGISLGAATVELWVTEDGQTTE
jgi:hypothetical protein